MDLQILISEKEKEETKQNMKVQDGSTTENFESEKEKQKANKQKNWMFIDD